jgi:hypothetical protein
MMPDRAVFLDTNGWIALLNSSDSPPSLHTLYSILPARRKRDLLDALAWLVLPVLLLSLLPIGYVSADGIGQSLSFSAGFQRWNPNHLLVEPLGVWWQGTPGSRAEGVDRLKRLSILAGALAAGLFRFGVAGRLASSRLAANHATAWLAFSSAFSRLWVSDEIHMIQMPAVVLVALLALRYLEQPSLSRAMAAGASVTLAAAFFVSNLLLGPALAAGVAIHKRKLHAVGILLGTFGTIVLVFGAVWIHSQTPNSFFDWLTRYGGGSQPARMEAAYGVEPTLMGLAVSTARALYGSACALVDLAPAVATFRDGLPVTPAVVFSLLAFAAASLLMAHALRDGSESTLLLVGVWAAAVLAFGIYWNNSDDQFYFQLSVAFGALAARLPIRRGLLVLSLAALLWNVIDLGTRRIFYPRRERLELLERELESAGLIVYPGFDEIEVLLELEPPRAPAVSITGLAVRYPVEEGMRDLSTAIEQSLSNGRPIALLDLFDTPRDRSPWKFLRRMGYDHDQVLDALRKYPMEPVGLEPFTLRWIRPQADDDRADLLRCSRRLPRLARGASRPRPRAAGGLLQEGLRPAQHHLARVRGRGALLRLDRRRAQAPGRGQLHHPLHTAQTAQQLERRQRRAGRGAHPPGTDAPGRPEGIRAAVPGEDRHLRL